LDQGAKFISLSFGFHIEKSSTLVWGFLPPAFVYLTLFIFLFSFVFLRQKLKIDYVFLALLLGGSVANLLDRIRFGYILDNLPFFAIFWFNLADLFILLSICILGQKLFLKKRV